MQLPQRCTITVIALHNAIHYNAQNQCRHTQGGAAFTTTSTNIHMELLKISRTHRKCKRLFLVSLWYMAETSKNGLKPGINVTFVHKCRLIVYIDCRPNELLCVLKGQQRGAYPPESV